MVFFHLLSLLVLLAAITLLTLRAILRRLHHMSAQLDALTAEVQETQGIIASAVTLINGIAARIDAAGGDPTALATLTTDLKASADGLAAAVAANQP